MANKAPRLRTCICCRQTKHQSEMIRIVRLTPGNCEIDGRKDGRGAYICKNEECIKKAKKEHRLEKAFKCAVDGGLYDKLGEFNE
mgnify:CR=1 FL=1